MTQPRTGGRFQPSLFDLVFLLWALVVPVGLSHRVLNNDGDLPRHLRLGEWMLSHGRVLTVDHFSYTLPGSPFLAFEWLSEVLFAAAHRAGGLAGVAILTGLVLGLTYALVVRFLLRRGVEPLLSYLASMAGALLGALHWVARPHLFTLLLVVVLLELLERREAPRLWWVAGLFALWANLHGGFTYGLILIAVYAGADLVDWRLRTGGAEALGRARGRTLALVAAGAGALLNPQGPALYGHVIDFFGKPLIVDQTQEFMSPDFHVFAGKVFLAIILLLVAGLALDQRRPATSHLLVLLANLAFSLHSARNIELFGVTALPLMALHFDPAWRRSRLLPAVRAAFADEAKARRRGVPALVGAILLLVLGLAHGRLGPVQLVADRFDPRVFPVAAVARARQAGLGGRLYSEFTWNGYVLHAWPEQRVFIDGGTDHYGEAVSADEIRLWSLAPRWDEVIERWKMSTMLLPRRSRLAYQLSRDPAWGLWYCDDLAMILLRRDASGGASPDPSPSPRCESES